ncbi:MAG: NAD(P)H-hydrate dehydratase [Eubacteriales bacterium]|jgi:hydroxyethylthiazole kinase-like uncharacterized protein yjeF
MTHYLLSAQQMRDTDAYAIGQLGIPSLTLMEQAGQAVFREVLARFTPASTVWIFCGKGNNGGDGLVLARLLARAHYPVRVIALAGREALSPDAQVMYDRLESTNVPLYYWPCQAEIHPRPEDLAVDALLGTGANRPLHPPFDELSALWNSLPCRKLAIDLPTGVDATTGALLGQPFRCDWTVTFCCEKYAHRLPLSQPVCGRVLCRDIGIPDEAVESTHPTVRLITQETLDQHMPRRDLNDHKGTYGHILLVGGSLPMSGAISMAGLAALRSGGGLVTLAVPDCIHSIVAGRAMEYMTLSLPSQEGSFAREAIPPILEFAQKCDAVAIGCGMGVTDATCELVHQLLTHLTCPLIVDADGINALSQHIDWLQEASCPVILTPHPGEMARLLHTDTPSVQSDRLECARRFSGRYDATVVLKGPSTVVAWPNGQLFVNISGTSGMATGGSGDVLTGVTAALTSFAGLRGKPSLAAALAVWLHGRAGELAAASLSQYGMTATDIVAHLPAVLKKYDYMEAD